MFHIPTPACRHSPSLHPNAGCYHFYLFFKSIYKSKPGQMRANKLESAGQMWNVNCVPGEEIPMGAAWSVLCARGKSTKCHIKSQLTWILLSAVFNTSGKTHPRPNLNIFCGFRVSSRTASISYRILLFFYFNFFKSRLRQTSGWCPLWSW